MNILYFNYFIPKNVEPLTSYAKRLNLTESEEKFYSIIMGIDSLPYLDNLTIGELLDAALTKLFNEQIISPDKIKWIIYTHTGNPTYPFGYNPLTAIREKFKLHNAIAFGTCAHKCASVITACEIATNLFTSLNPDEYILVLTADLTFTNSLQHIPGTAIMTEGSAVILLTKQEQGHQIVSTETSVYGKFSKGIWCENEEKQEFEKSYPDYLANNIFLTIEKANLTLDDIKFIFPHNTNVLSWIKTAKKIGITKEKIYTKNISTKGHCFGVDPWLNLHDASQEKLLQKGDYIILTTVGLGASFASMVVKY